MKRLHKLNLLVKPTNDCNINCQYCFDRLKREQLRGQRLTLRQIEKLARLASEVSSDVDWIWHGGEPTLMGRKFYEEAQPLILQNYTTNFSQSLQSNGINIAKDSEWLEFFKTNGIYFGVSYDSLTQYIRSDKIDLSAIFDYQVMESNSCGAITVLNKSNVSKMIDMYDNLKIRYKGKFILCFNPIFETESGENTGLEISLEEFKENYTKFVHHVFYDTTAYASTERTFMMYLRGLLGYEKFGSCRHGHCEGNWLCIIGNGDIYPCDIAVETYKLGNLNEIESFDEILDSAIMKQYINDIARRFEQHCNSCSYYRLCGGGCNSAHALSKKPNRAYNLSENQCEQLKTLVDIVYKELIQIDSLDSINPKIASELRNNNFVTMSEIGTALNTVFGVDLTKDLKNSDKNTYNSNYYKLFNIFNGTPLNTKTILATKKTAIIDILETLN